MYEIGDDGARSRLESIVGSYTPYASLLYECIGLQWNMNVHCRTDGDPIARAGYVTFVRARVQ